MSDEQERGSRAWIIGSPILMGTSAGFIIAMLHPESLEFSVGCASLGGLIGLAVGIATWLSRHSS
jgi:hypothetical protein